MFINFSERSREGHVPTLSCFVLTRHSYENAAQKLYMNRNIIVFVNILSNFHERAAEKPTNKILHIM